MHHRLEPWQGAAYHAPLELYHNTHLFMDFVVQKICSALEPSPYREECWHWIGSYDKEVPVLYVCNKRYLATHFSYLRWRGPIEEQVVESTCRVPLCVHPRHLRLRVRRHGARTKLTDKQAQDIRWLYAQEKTPVAKLAEDFGVSTRWVYEILRSIS